MTEEYGRYHKRDWVQWCGRILKKDSKSLMRLAKILQRKGKIQKLNRNTVLRFALLSLLRTLEKYEAADMKEQRTAELKELAAQQEAVENRRMSILDAKKEEELAKIQAENEAFIKKQQERIKEIEVSTDV